MRISGGLTVLSGIGLFFLEGLEEGFDHILNFAFIIKIILVALAGGWAFLRKNADLTRQETIFHALLLTLIIIIATLFL